MYITIEDKEFELSTKLGTAVKIEKRFKQPLSTIVSVLKDAEINELIEIITIAAKPDNTSEIKELVLDNWDYSDIQSTVQNLLTDLMFSGTLEQKSEKINNYPTTEEGKNILRKMVGIATSSSGEMND